MAEIKLVINDPKTGKSYPKQYDGDLSGLKIGEKLAGNLIGLHDFECEITGGSDNAGFPMRKDIPTANRKSALIGSGSGVHIKQKGVKLRKTIRGNTIGATTAQVNIKIVKYGKEPIEKVLGIEAKEEKKEEKNGSV